MSDDHPSHGSRSTHRRRRGCGWVVTVDVSSNGRHDLAVCASELYDLLAPYAGDVTLDVNRSRIGATFSIGEPDLDAASALAYGSKIFHDLATRAGLPIWPIVHAEVTHITDQPTLRVVH